MAGDWIPCDTSLFKKREVLAIARETKRSRHEVAGLLLDFWGWLSTESTTGDVVDVPVDALVDVVGADVKFWEAVVASGWIIALPSGGLTIPNADHWLNSGAKARLQKNRRQERWRGGRVDAQPSTDVSSSDDSEDTPASTEASTTEENSTEQKRREEKSSESGEEPESRVAKPRRRPTKRLPDGFVFKHSPVEMGEALGLDAATVEWELGKFRDFEFKSAKSDWDATLRNWLRGAAERRGVNRPRPVPGDDSLAGLQGDLCSRQRRHA